MLGKTAGGIFWLFRYLERAESMARLLDAGHRIALTRPTDDSEDEWRSIVTTAGASDTYLQRHDNFRAAQVLDFLLRDRSHPGSVLAMMAAARTNARLTRTALTREVWEGVNEAWLTLSATLARPVREAELPIVLGEVRRQSALVRGAVHGTMLRNEIYNFARLGTFIERADATARILDVKYFVLLPSIAHVGSTLDNAQWETILRSAGAQRSYRWLNPDGGGAVEIAEFLMLDRRFPRSLAFCSDKIIENLAALEADYGSRVPAHDAADQADGHVRGAGIAQIFEYGLHEWLGIFLGLIGNLGTAIERDFRFYG